MAVPAWLLDPTILGVHLTIARDGAVAFEGHTSVAEIVRPLETLTEHLVRAYPLPAGAWLLTGTGIVPPSDFTLDDWMIVVDYLVQRYLPADDLRAEADWLATRAAFMGRVEAALGEATPEQADALLQAMPSNAGQAGERFGLTPLQLAILEYGNARCAENVVGLSDAARRAYLLEDLRGKPRPWLAHFRATLAIAGPGAQIQTVDGECRGEIIPEDGHPLEFNPQRWQTRGQPCAISIYEFSHE